MSRYEIKWLAELGWAVLIAVAVFVLTGLVGIEGVGDWKTWAVGLATGSVRVAAAVALNFLRERFPTLAKDVPAG